MAARDETYTMMTIDQVAIQITSLIVASIELSNKLVLYFAEEFPKISLPLQDLEAALQDLESHHMKISSKAELRSKSLPRPAKAKPEYGPRRDFDDQRHFEDDPRDMYEMHDLHDVDYENYKERQALERERRREREELYGYRDRGYDPEDEDFEFDYPKGRRSRRDMRWVLGL